MPSLPSNVTHINGTATTSPDALSLPATTRSVLIQNTEQSAANDLLVSFDGGSTFKTLKRLAAIKIAARITSITVKSSGGSVDYEAVVAS